MRKRSGREREREREREKGKDSHQGDNECNIDNSTGNLRLLAPVPRPPTAAAAADTYEVDGHENEDTDAGKDGHTCPDDDCLAMRGEKGEGEGESEGGREGGRERQRAGGDNKLRI